MTPIAERLKIFFLYKQVNINELASILGYPQPEKLYRLFRKKNAKPSVDILEDISNKFEELNINWIITGKGEMLRSDEEKNSSNGSEKTTPEDLEALHLLEAAKKMYENLLDKQGQLIASQAAHISSLELLLKEKKED